MSLARAGFREVLRVARRRGYNQRFAVVVGSGDLAETVVQRLRARPDVGMQVLGVVGDDKDEIGAARWLGAYADLRAVLDAHSVDHIVLALPHEDYGRLPGLLDAIGDEPVTIHVVPDLFRFTSLRGGVEEFEGMPFIHLRESPLYGWNRLVKRVFDVAFSTGALVLLAPAHAAGGGCDQAHLAGPDAVSPGAHGAGRTAIPDAQVPDDARWMPRKQPGRYGPARTIRGARPSARLLRRVSPRRAARSSSTPCAGR